VEWSRVRLLISDRTNFPMDGVELVQRVRVVCPNLPIVFVSAWAEELERELRGSGLAAQDYIECGPC
jgi:DNA-binding response OmpR family regulator